MSRAGPKCRLSSAIGVVHIPGEGDEIFRVVELRPGLFEFTFVHLKRGIERRVLLDRFYKPRIDAGTLIERFVALFEGFCAQWFVG
jgi:hypothetical protein